MLWPCTMFSLNLSFWFEQRSPSLSISSPLMHIVFLLFSTSGPVFRFTARLQLSCLKNVCCSRSSSVIGQIQPVLRAHEIANQMLDTYVVVHYPSIDLQKNYNKLKVRVRYAGGWKRHDSCSRVQSSVECATILSRPGGAAGSLYLVQSVLLRRILAFWKIGARLFFPKSSLHVGKIDVRVVRRPIFLYTVHAMSFCPHSFD